MSHSIGLLFGIGFVYLVLLFLIAFVADSGRLPERLIRHPVVYVFSLGVYATSWTYYGSVGFAQTQGFLFLTIYLGVTLAFALSPLLLQPILRLTQEYQLTSLADLFAFRYRSQLAGVLSQTKTQGGHANGKFGVFLLELGTDLQGKGQGGQGIARAAELHPGYLLAAL